VPAHDVIRRSTSTTSTSTAATRTMSFRLQMWRAGRSQKTSHRWLLGLLSRGHLGDSRGCAHCALANEP